MRPNRLRAAAPAGRAVDRDAPPQHLADGGRDRRPHRRFDYVEFSGEYAPYDLHGLDDFCRAAELMGLGAMIKLDQEPRDVPRPARHRRGLPVASCSPTSGPSRMPGNASGSFARTRPTAGARTAPPTGATTYWGHAGSADYIRALKEIVVALMIEKRDGGGATRRDPGRARHRHDPVGPGGLRDEHRPARRLVPRRCQRRSSATCSASASRRASRPAPRSPSPRRRRTPRDGRAPLLHRHGPLHPPRLAERAGRTPGRVAGMIGERRRRATVRIRARRQRCSRTCVEATGGLGPIDRLDEAGPTTPLAPRTLFQIPARRRWAGYAEPVRPQPARPRHAPCGPRSAEQLVVCRLLHDAADRLVPANHGQIAAELLPAICRVDHYWMVRMHGLFQKDSPTTPTWERPSWIRCSSPIVASGLELTRAVPPRLRRALVRPCLRRASGRRSSCPGPRSLRASRTRTRRISEARSPVAGRQPARPGGQPRSSRAPAQTPAPGVQPA